jgi:hypothetical protein
VMARVAPEDKIRLVRLYQEEANIVSISTPRLRHKPVGRHDIRSQLDLWGIVVYTLFGVSCQILRLIPFAGIVSVNRVKFPVFERIHLPDYPDTRVDVFGEKESSELKL